MNIVDPDARITHYCSECFERLEGIGCGQFREDNPEKTIKLLLQRVRPHRLGTEMKKILEFDESIRKNVRKFISKLSTEAINCQSYLGLHNDSISFELTDQPRSTPKPNARRPCRGKRTRSRAVPQAMGSRRDPLIYLYPPHSAAGLRHYLVVAKVQ